MVTRVDLLTEQFLLKILVPRYKISSMIDAGWHLNTICITYIIFKKSPFIEKSFN
jgi:hypothetical protein